MESRKTSMGGANTEVSENAPTDTNARTSNEPVEFDGSVSEEARRQMIAQAAYFIAERNGFVACISSTIGSPQKSKLTPDLGAR